MSTLGLLLLGLMLMLMKSYFLELVLFGFGSNNRLLGASLGISFFTNLGSDKSAGDFISAVSIVPFVCVCPAVVLAK